MSIDYGYNAIPQSKWFWSVKPVSNCHVFGATSKSIGYMPLKCAGSTWGLSYNNSLLACFSSSEPDKFFYDNSLLALFSSSDNRWYFDLVRSICCHSVLMMLLGCNVSFRVPGLVVLEIGIRLIYACCGWAMNTDCTIGGHTSKAHVTHSQYNEYTYLGINWDNSHVKITICYTS